MIYVSENPRMYAIHRLGVAVEHVLGPDVRVETHMAGDGYMFLYWFARLSEEQVAKVVGIHGVSDTWRAYLFRRDANKSFRSRASRKIWIGQIT